MLRVIKVSLSSPMPLWGSDASISCDVTPWPRGASLQWTLNNRTFDPQSGSDSDADQRVVREKATVRLTESGPAWWASGGRGESVCSSDCEGNHPPPLSDKSASLTEVEVGDKGRYRCSGTLDGQQLTRNMELVVAKIISSPPPSKTSVTLTCDLTDSSEVTDYEWVQLISDINGSQSVQSVQKGISLSINTESEENQGEWACLFYGKHVYKNHRRRKRIFQFPALETIVHTNSNEQEERERNQEKK
ncbi:hypothetical protein KUCAC02_014333 [Chaenocephalus aceratus]|uniref:Uncharacterized protein n=1 Tax=Chaenocephalus aceratus TaxID=36190 RepID=A0ACB9WEV3_CHAAC|nr:hypothetical protein KUCAC02_014333 [Chaenocephalus aceratus]